MSTADHKHWRVGCPRIGILLDEPYAEKPPLWLQDHGDPVCSYISWVLELLDPSRVLPPALSLLRTDIDATELQ